MTADTALVGPMHSKILRLAARTWTMRFRAGKWSGVKLSSQNKNWSVCTAVDLCFPLLVSYHFTYLGWLWTLPTVSWPRLAKAPSPASQTLPLRHVCRRLDSWTTDCIGICIASFRLTIMHSLHTPTSSPTPRTCATFYSPRWEYLPTVSHFTTPPNTIKHPLKIY